MLLLVNTQHKDNFVSITLALMQVLFLDSDNYPLLNPSSLFNADAYKKHGNLFWADYWCACLVVPLTAVPMQGGAGQ